jgi:hypothetical protein
MLCEVIRNTDWGEVVVVVVVVLVRAGREEPEERGRPGGIK